MFLSALVVKEVGVDEWVRQADLVYEGRYETFTVPAGTRTDFASIPGQLRWFVPKYGRYNRAAVLHDWLSARADRREFDRADADGIFRRSMRELGVGLLRRWLMWAAVRLASRLEGADAGHAALAAGITIVVLPFAGPGLIIAQILIWLYQLLELIAYGARSFARKISRKPPLDEPRPRPRMYWSK